MVLESVIANNDIKSSFRAVKVTIPSLSLDHQSIDNKQDRNDEHDSGGESYSSNADNNKKSVAEKLAISLLARPITFVEEHVVDDVARLDCKETSTKFVVDACTNALDNATKTLLENIIQSFTTLVDSRLHAYATFLHRHAMVLSGSIENEDSCSSCCPSDEDDDSSDRNSNRSADAVAEERVRCIINKIEAILHVGHLLSVSTTAIGFEPSFTVGNSDQSTDDAPFGNFRFVLTIGCHLSTDMNTVHSTDSYYTYEMSAPVCIQGKGQQDTRRWLRRSHI
jgi:hypothetical protein